MRPKRSSAKRPVDRVIKDVFHADGRHFSAKDMMPIVIDDLRGDGSVAVLRRREGIVQSLSDSQSKVL